MTVAPLPRACRLLVLAALVAVASPAAADELPAAHVKLFEQRIRPLLVANCFACHGPDKQKGELRLDSRAAMLAGGESGPAVTPGDPETSLLVDAVRYGAARQMPPKGKLPDAQIAALVEWIKLGAPWPDQPAVAGIKSDADDEAPAFTAEQKAFWSFQPPVDPPLPEVKNGAWAKSPVDRFVLVGLEAKALAPAPAADKRTLLRRATFDLVGLPPTPEELAAFLADDSPDAFARVVDRLLASPRYGERWGRHWLDVARYADSNGMDENLAYVNAYRYRDWVIAAFNVDKPYDEFVREQLAGDLLPPSNDEATNAARIVATGLLVLGPKMLAEDDPVKMEMDIVDEQVDTVGQAFLGLTLGCARCHDHKFDPVPAADYYALAGIFKSTRSMDNLKVVAQWHERTISSRDQQERVEAHRRQVELVKARAETLARDEDDLLALALGPFVAKQEKREAYYTPAGAREIKRLRDQLGELEKQAPQLDMAMAVEEGKPEDLRIHVRGSHWTLSREVKRGFPRILAGENQPPLPAEASGRLQLAQWLTRPDHPLTARVIVNRVWRWHFGAGLVRTPDNFGRLGNPPTNPPLLDWLSHRFVEGGWSLKALHRLIMLSSTYQMSTANNERSTAIDPENQLLWRINRRRLEAEVLRDAILAVAGQLDDAAGGSLLANKPRQYVTGTASTNDTRYDSRRRSVYLPVVRSALYDVFQAFDFADPSTLNGDRPTTTVAPQALFMMNSKLVLEASRGLAELLLAQDEADDAGRVHVAYERLYARPPSTEESTRALVFVRDYEAALAPQEAGAAARRLRAWEGLCRVLMAANEFVYVE
ncbi:MAG: PSD1 domain-containing protein [Planctomycetia bacterium]|nr:PSD1 domain-containing protein [Planctomycetia bacterium]